MVLCVLQRGEEAVARRGRVCIGEVEFGRQFVRNRPGLVSPFASSSPPAVATFLARYGNVLELHALNPLGLSLGTHMLGEEVDRVWCANF